MAISDQFHQHCHWLSPTCWPAHHVTGPSHQDSPCLNDVNATPLHFRVALSCVATSRRQNSYTPGSHTQTRQRRHANDDVATANSLRSPHVTTIRFVRRYSGKYPRLSRGRPGFDSPSGSQLLQPSPNRAGLSKDEELQLSWQVLFTVTKNPGTTNIIPYKIQVYQWQYMYNNTFHNKNHLTSSSYCVQMPWHQLSQQLGRRHLLTNHHISFKFLYMTKHQGTGRLAWNRHFKANLPWEKLERNHKSITHNLSVKSLHCPKHWLVAGLATSHCLTQWMDTELTTLRIPNLPMQA